MSEPALSFVHRFVPARRPGVRPLLLLHGTGGNEDDMIPLGTTLGDGAALLSLRGKVSERGMPRFFRRVAEGVFDQEDVRRRAEELADFVAAARERYQIAAPFAVGYSNGANVAAALMLLRPQALAGAILLRATMPLDDPPAADLAGLPVLILSGEQDTIIAPASSQRLAELLVRAGARVAHRTLPLGHELSPVDVTMGRQWFATNGAEPAPAAPA